MVGTDRGQPRPSGDVARMLPAGRHLAAEAADRCWRGLWSYDRRTDCQEARWSAMIRAIGVTVLWIALALPSRAFAAPPADFPTANPPGHWFTETSGYPIPTTLGYG